VVQDHTLGPTATLDVHVVTDGGAPTPAKLTFVGIEGTDTPELGPRFRAAGAGNVIASVDGRASLALPPGTYVVYASRGPEFDLAQQRVVLAAGAHVRAQLAVHHVVDTSGYLSADFHQHSLVSNDAGMSTRDRVITNLAEGVEVAVSTEHNQIFAFAPLVDAMGVRDRVAAVTGLEATTQDLGHFNVYPLEPDPEAPRNGAPAVDGLGAADLLERLRQLDLAAVVQVNHPRSGHDGYFDHVDPRDDHEHTYLLFDALEVVNGKRMLDIDKTLGDWFWLLDEGRVVTATGGSDSHAVVGEEAGYPRNFVGAGTDDPARLSETALVDAVKTARHVIVSNGPFVTVKVAGENAIGRTLTRRAGDIVELEVTVQAAPWVDCTEIELRAGHGEPARRIPVAAPAGKVVRFAQRIPVRVTRDNWHVVIVRGEKPLYPVVQGREALVHPFALTNPVWVRVR